MADRMVFFRIARTGGGATALDGIDGTDRGDGNPLQDLDAAIVEDSGYYYPYIGDIDSGLAESDPDIIKPDTNAGDFRWIFQKSPYLISGTGAPPAAAGLPDGAMFFKYTP